MKRLWTIHRQSQTLLDAQHRWDRAFQLLLPITVAGGSQQIQAVDQEEEVQHESRTLCARLDQSPGPHPIH